MKAPGRPGAARQARRRPGGRVQRPEGIRRAEESEETMSKHDELQKSLAAFERVLASLSGRLPAVRELVADAQSGELDPVGAGKLPALAREIEEDTDRLRELSSHVQELLDRMNEGSSYDRAFVEDDV